MVVNVSWQVFSRHVLDDPPAWTEEIARYVFTWQIFLGAALAFGRGSHIMVDAVMAALSGRAKRIVAILGYLASLALLIPLVWFGIAMVELTSNTWATASNLNIGVVYAALPVGAAIGALYVILHLVHVLRGGEATHAQASTMID
jgi:TRAP-type C4-dicarboxylate transport system permease small subunit